MQLETIRSLADWLQYGTNTAAGAVNGPSSVNALLPNVPRDAIDAAPDQVLTFGDETRMSVLARRSIPRDSTIVYPLLGVIGTDSGDIDGEVETAVRDGTLTATVVYAHQNTLTDAGLRNWHYTARAIEQSLKQWLLNSHVSFRTRNGIIVMACEKMRLLAPFAQSGDVVFAGGLSLQFSVRDTAP